MSSHQSRCAICLEPLLGHSRKPLSDDGKNNQPDNKDDQESSANRFGALHPCGHPIHEGCFRAWEASKIADHAESDKDEEEVCQVPCPICQQPTSSFLRVFLNPAAVVPQDDEDDGCSGDSSDDSDDDECEDDDGNSRGDSATIADAPAVRGLHRRKCRTKIEPQPKKARPPHKKKPVTVKHKLLRQKYQRTKQQLAQCQKHFQSARSQMEVMQEEMSGMEFGIILLKLRHDQTVRQAAEWKRKCLKQNVTSVLKTSGMAAVWLGLGWGVSQLGLIGIKYRG